MADALPEDTDIEEIGSGVTGKLVIAPITNIVEGNETNLQTSVEEDPFIAAVSTTETRSRCPLWSTFSFPIKEIGMLLFLSILLPSYDVYSDVYLILRLMWKQHLKWTALMLIPFLCSYALGWWTWFRLKEQRIRFSCIFPALSCFPQFLAGNVIYKLWITPEQGMKEKRKFERNVSELEIFSEAVPTTNVITFLMVRAIASSADSEEFELIIGSSTLEVTMFFSTYATSIISASLGMAKCLKLGPCRVLADGGVLGGFCSGRFFLLFFSMGLTMGSKAGVLALTMTEWKPYDLPTKASICLGTMFLPGFLVALVSLCHSKHSLRSILNHPSLFLLPVFTYFTFSASHSCCRRKVSGASEPMIKFSRNWSLANILVSVLGHVAWGVSVSIGRDHYSHDAFIIFYLLCLPIPIVGVLLTLLYLSLDCCSRCCSVCCCFCTCIPEVQQGVLKPSDPLTEFIMVRDDSGVKVLIEMEGYKQKQKSDSLSPSDLTSPSN